MSVSFRSAQTIQEDGTVVLALEGELDLIASPELKALLVEVASSAPALVVDLARVRFVDSTGLALLIQAKRRMDVRSGAFAIANAVGQPLSLLRISGLQRLMSRKDAAAS